MRAGLSVANDPSRPRIAPRFANPMARSIFSSPLKMFVALVSLALLTSAWACLNDTQTQSLRPRQLRDVPARRLAFNFQADVDPPAGNAAEEVPKLPAIQQECNHNRKDEAQL